MMNLSTVIAYGCRYCAPQLKQLLNYTTFLCLPHHLHLQRRSPSFTFYSSFNNLKLPNFNLLLTGNSLFFRMERFRTGSGINKNKQMVEHLQRYGVISSKKVAEVMETIDRALFVPDGTLAYVDSPMAIGYNATISAPHMHAMCLQLLEENLQPGMHALDVGSDGRQGWPDCAPCDAIHVGAAAAEIPQPLLDQLKPGGRMVIPVGDIFQDLKVVDKNLDGSISIRNETSVRYVPLTSRDAQLRGY
ncbi:protein-L-isoaspartate O-methyltransferase 2-like isoform X2 [Durio zibethinus]|uniref:Protein-L-isoaspartate O-methyltransferase 2-like isoform X2 n=1 Tax=Durio zibethinus TaxID=66656 RepID=A0A6P6AYK7_DURZI|nr:protein-L-isoaspartate O-methyltransferase 2-like isoform X2 [Durio zibethinus]